MAPLRPNRIRRIPIETDRVSLRACLRVVSLDGLPLAPEAECREIGLTGLRATAAQGITPGTEVCVSIRLPTGPIFEMPGWVSGCCTTLHLAPFGSCRGCDDDATLEIEFTEQDPDQLWPIASLLLQRRSSTRSSAAHARRRRSAIPGLRPA